MLKRRKLKSGHEVLIIYDVNIGFIQKRATFKEYRTVSYGDITHEAPIFECEDEKISGLHCFWITLEDIISRNNIEQVQYELIGAQIKALEVSKTMGYNIPTKIKDKAIENMADDNLDRMSALIKKLGFDPRDDSWVENSLASDKRERDWFRFQRENGFLFSKGWDDIISVYNNVYKDDLTPEQAKLLSKKYMRYIMGAYHTRMSGIASKDEWKRAARTFERTHRLCEERMKEWSIAHRDHFPLVRVKSPIIFKSGPYFNECIERIPEVFTNNDFTRIKEGIVLSVISYDPELKYIRLDFTPDVRRKIKNEDTNIQPWIKDQADYDFFVKPEEIESHLEILESLE